MMRHHSILLISMLVLGACDDAPTSPDTTTTTPTTSNVAFEGTLDRDESRFYSFSISQTGTVSVNLASLNLVGHREALGVPVRVGVGVPQGEGCADTESIEMTPALVSQMSTTSLGTGIHCVSVTDIGQLPGPTTFLIRFTYP